MKNIFKILIILILFTACESDLVDFTRVTNPSLSESSVIGQDNSAQAWLVGTMSQFSIVSNSIVTASEIASDNYVNTQTFFNQFLDNLDVQFQDAGMLAVQFSVGRLREMAVYGLENVVPNDPNATDMIRAEFEFYKGISYLLAGEYFSFLPAEVNGVPLSSEENYQLAVTSFKNAIAIQDDAKYNLALARTYYNLKDKANAILYANNVISMDPLVLFVADFDRVNLPASTIQSALYGRGSFDDLQPLPSLDFLDPKYSFLSNAQDQSTPFLKAEEAYFIITEAQLSDNNLNGAKETMKSLITLISSRETRQIDDSAEDRDQRNPGTRPNKASDLIRYEGDTEYKSGHVIDRNSNVTVPVISGTSITNTIIDNLSTVDEALEILYLMRQEVFIAEGRRVLDLGIKYVLHENELLLNPNVDANHPGLTGVIPPFIDAIKTELDAFTYDSDAGTAEIKHNLNKILVANKTSDLIIPFF